VMLAALKTPISTSAFVAAALLFSACSSSEKLDLSTPDGAYALAKKYEEGERYEEAIGYYRDVKNKHPYSRFAVLSELAVADIEFKRENFAEAEANYRVFKEMHPSHEKSDYVTYQLGMSLFKQLPPTTDRDLSEAQRAIIYFEEVLSSFPNSEYRKDAEEKWRQVKTMLAEKEIYIADFYFRTKRWSSALGRYEDVLRKHPGLGFEERALFGATVSAYRSRDLEKARKLLASFATQFPKSGRYDEAKREVER
jgi:outer membrane protein assembly factor BamD